MPKTTVSFILPHPSLREMISAYYVAEPPGGEPAVSDLLHPEWANIRIVLKGIWTLGDQTSDVRSEPAIYGPTSRATPIRGEGAGLGIGLLPRGWATFVDAASSALADRVAPVAQVMGAKAAIALSRLRSCADHGERAAKLDAFFLARLAARGESPAVIGQAHAVLMRPEIATVEPFAAALGLTLRQVHRLSVRVFGFPPKLLLRRQRFLRTLAVLRQNLDRPWADLIDPRYYDQSHLVRDFQRFMGMSPTQYFALPRDMLEPAAVARTASVGQPLQGLQPPIVAVSDSSKPSPPPTPTLALDRAATA
jgi:AraC-like DNA-binding protein